MNFINLYAQTEYSMLESSLKIDEYVSAAKSSGYDSIAITDYFNMHGAIKFYQLCKKNNIKPILGLKIKYQYQNTDSSLLLYAMNDLGYRNLMKVASRGKMNKQAMELDVIEKYKIGVLAIIPSEENEIISLMYQNRFEEARRLYNQLSSIFDYLYVGLALQSEQENKFFGVMYQYLKQQQLPMVAIHKTNFLEVEDIVVYKALQTIEDASKNKEATLKEKNSYLLGYDEAMFRFEKFGDLIANSQQIANLCTIEINFSTYHLPKYPIEQNVTSDFYLQELCKLGLNKRLSGKQVDVESYKNRLLYELDIIKKTGFSDYFLIVWDFVKYAKNNNILVGPGRGSAPASLVSYSLGITDVDPIEYQLVFERFLNQERITMPDIDLDFPDDQRDVVIKYVGQKYGKNRVAHIVTFGTFAARSSIRDMARVYKLEEYKLNEIIKLVPSGPTNNSLKAIVEESKELKQLMVENQDIRRVIEIAIKLEGLPRHTSTHAAGIIITKEDIVEYTPVDEGLDDIYQTQYSASDLEDLGLLKMDFLGLRNLTIIDKVIKLIQEHDDPNFRLNQIHYHDKPTFELIAKADTMGVFQLESAGMRQVLRALKVSSLDDIIVAIALFRPGPMEMIPSFVRRKFRQEEIHYPHKDLESILKSTYGTIVYQEQIMLIAQKFAGYTLGEADILRRAVSKKNLQAMQDERSKFVQKAVQNRYSEEDANTIYDYIVKFANYGFNKAHSVAYAIIAYQMAFLKVNYFKHFMSVLLSSVIGSEKAMGDYISEATRNKVKVLPPSINYSSSEFHAELEGIRYPLLGIQNIGFNTLNDILEERRKGKFLNYKDFIGRTQSSLSKRVVESLIYANALDEFGLTKKYMIESYDNVIQYQNYSDIIASKMVDQTPSEDEFSYDILQSKEKEMLGVHIKYNFFALYYDLREERKLKTVIDLQMEPKGSKVECLVMVRRIKEIQTKNKQLMAFLEAYDDTLEIDCVMFPPVYEQFFKSISKHIVMIVSGVMDQRNDKPQLIIDKVEML